MAEQWIVRVQGREYGPVGVDELREWRREGRLIRENEVREADGERWIRAEELPEVFADESANPPPLPAVSRLSFGEIVADSWKIFRLGFGRFFLLGLLVAVPAFFLQIAVPFLEMPKAGAPIGPAVISGAIAFVSLALLVIAWPISIAGLQVLAADLHSGRNPTFREVFQRAKPLWGRIFLLALIVYGSYFLWTIVPLMLAFSLAAGEPSLATVMLALCLMCFTIYTVARLFINFLFWQQAGALGSKDAMEALRESKTLARSTDLPWSQRPLFRGAIIASVWLLLVIGINVAIELPAVLYRLREVTNLEQATNLLQAMTAVNSHDPLATVTTLLSTLAHATLRPWLAAIFVVLYLDTKANGPK